MAYDINAIRITGTVERFDIVSTKAGTPMIRLTVRCFKELFTVVAFKELAETTRLNAGERVEVRGRVQSNTWADRDGNKRYGFQVVATDIGAAVEEGREALQGGKVPPHRSAPPREDRSGVMECRGGPF